MVTANVVASSQRERGNPVYHLAVLQGWIASSAMPPRDDDSNLDVELK